MEEEKKATTKKELKQKAQEIKLEEKQKRLEEKQAIKEEKERRKNSFGRKVKNFFLTIIFIIILLLVAFYFGKRYLGIKEKELNDKKMSQTYQTALSEIERKDYKKAIEILKAIDENYSKYNEVKDKLSEVEQLYLNEYLSDADKYLKEEKFDRALSVLEKVDSEFKDSEVIANKISEIHVAKIKYDVSELEKDKNVIEILKYLTNYDKEISEDINDEIEDLISKYKSQFLLESRELMKTNYIQAKENIVTVEKMLPNDKDIKALVEELNKLEPTSISLLTLDSEVKSDKLTISAGDQQVKDAKGTEYKNYILSQGNTTGEKNITNTIEFKLDKKYSKLEGQICIKEEVKALSEYTNTDISNIRITMYNDKKVIYFSDSIDKNKLENTNFSVDVTNVEKLKIEFNGDTQIQYFIANPTLTLKK